MEWATSKTKLPRHKDEGEMKRVAKSKPIVVVTEVVLPVEVGFALSIVPPHIARVGIAIKRIV